MQVNRYGTRLSTYSSYCQFQATVFAVLTPMSCPSSRWHPESVQRVVHEPNLLLASGRPAPSSLSRCILAIVSLHLNVAPQRLPAPKKRGRQVVSSFRNCIHNAAGAVRPLFGMPTLKQARIRSVLQKRCHPPPIFSDTVP